MSVFCFDLDSTICYWNPSKEFPYGRPEDCTPIRDRVMRVNQLYEQGHTIIIDTARGTRTGKDTQKLTEKQLEEWGVKYHILRTGIKFSADFYIDDLAINSNDFFE